MRRGRDARLRRARRTADANGWSKERGYVCPDDGSFDPGALYCFIGGRYFVKPPRAPWDAHPALWAARPDQTVFRLRLVTGNDGDGEWFAADQGYLEELRLSGGEILAGGDGVGARLERLSAPEDKAARAAMAALLTIEEACARAYRCSSSIYPWTDLGRSTSLRACVEQEASTRVIVEKKLGSDAAKEACP